MTLCMDWSIGSLLRLRKVTFRQEPVCRIRRSIYIDGEESLERFHRDSVQVQLQQPHCPRMFDEQTQTQDWTVVQEKRTLGSQSPSQGTIGDVTSVLPTAEQMGPSDRTLNPGSVRECILDDCLTPSNVQYMAFHN